jgi:hypothetical protein
VFIYLPFSLTKKKVLISSVLLFYIKLTMVPIKDQESYFLKLPSEVIQTIIDLASIVTEREDDQDCQFLGWSYPEHSYVHLTSIALCCRRLYILCAPFLWKDKEFILPREDDEKSDNASVQMATDILSKKALFQHDYYLGDYVRSLSRDLTSGPHFDLINSKLMAQLVGNLRALRIDFHPLSRTKHYGLCYFSQYCPQLIEVYLNNCHDTFDDFLSLVEFHPPLISLTLTNCTIKESTFEKLSSLLKPTLKHLLLQQVLTEPTLFKKTNSHLMNTQSFIHPFHYHDTQVTAIPHRIYHQFALHSNLTQFALATDSISSSLLRKLVQHAPKLEKLAILLHDLIPYQVQQSLLAISSLDRLTTLSIGFRKYYPVTKECAKLPCHTPAVIWSVFAKGLTQLRLLRISATRITVTSDFIPTLLNSNPYLKNAIIHSLALVTIPNNNIELIETDNEDMVRDAYIRDCKYLTMDIQDWNDEYLYTFEQAKERVCDEYFDETDHVCFIKGFSSANTPSS